ncbi:Gfo/Idh/MocA family protein [Microbacterium sp. RU33B]|uniref:Gfo/Idh/MocA family protein n=1 Tax=Microbacterium sp. RU33B TaxID=1907390 RepID=UPI00095CA520|nr:Gfo/Idh/MocA family oxidoreductase [Microbacterium sp. RU33B]SIT66770.1 Predicted dehydrogenase [Microbacterium sp. RU33B]
MSTPEIRLATTGTSVITSTFADAVSQVDGIRIEAVSSRDGERAAAKAAECGANWSGTYDDVLASPLVDAVYIASPNSAHHAQALRAIAAGKHVIVEKPAVTTEAEWAELVERARQADVVLLEAMRTEYDPGMDLVRSLLADLGRLRHASLRYEKQSSRYAKVLAGERVNMFDPALAGGALNDLGVYCLHAMVMLFGVPDGLAAASVGVSSGVDGAGTVLARYPGFVVDLSYSKISSSAIASEIQGEEGTLVIDDIAAPRSVELVGIDGSRVRHDVEAPENPLVHEVRRFAELIASGGDASADQRLTGQTLRLIEEVRRVAPVV